MAYTNAVFFMNLESGSDAARSTLTGVVFSNPSSTTVLGTYVSHNLVTGAVIDVTGCTQAYANSAWKITWVSADTFTLDDALWASFNGADVTGNAVPRGGSSWTDAWLTISAGSSAARIQPGDEIRIAKSPTPVSTSISATFTNPPNVANAAVAITSSTNATPIVVTSTAHGLVNGDVVYIYDHATNLSANGVWVVTKVNDNSYSLNNSVGIGSGTGGYGVKATCKVLKMASALPVKTVTRCEVAWTASGSSTVSKTTSYYKDGDGGVSFAKSSPSNSTLYAYYPVSGDFSSYQALSFWFYPGTVIADANKWSIWLCTSADGTNPVDEFKIPALPAASMWYPLNITKEGGGNLSGSVASIAIYSGTSAATLATSYFDCFVATKTNDLNLLSLVGKSSADAHDGEPWFPIRSFSEDSTLIVLDVDNGTSTGYTCMVGRGGGYYGTPESATLYRRETSKAAKCLNTSQFFAVQDSGSAGSVIKFTGGYNTSSGDRDGDTWIEGWNSANTYNYFNVSNRSYIEVDHINLARSQGFYASTTANVTLKNVAATGCYSAVQLTAAAATSFIIEDLWQASNGSYGIYINYDALTVDAAPYICNNQNHGIYLYDQHSHSINVTGTNCCNNGQYGINISGSNNDMSFANINNNGLTSAGIYLAASSDHNRIVISGNLNYNGYYAIDNSGERTRVYGGTSTGSVTAGVRATNGQMFLHNYTASDSTPTSVIAVGTTASKFRDMGLFFTNYGATAGDHRSYLEGGTIIYQKTIYHTPSVGGWKLSPTNAARRLEYPLSVVLAKIYCQANKLVTVQCHACRDNTGITVMLVCRKGQLATSDLATNKTDTMTAAAGTWDSDQANGETLEITFTPTEAGVVEIEGWAYGGTAYNAYFSDMTITQAD